MFTILPTFFFPFTAGRDGERGRQTAAIFSVSAAAAAAAAATATRPTITSQTLTLPPRLPSIPYRACHPFPAVPAILLHPAIHSLPCLPSHYILPSIPCRACHLITSYHPFPAVPAISLHPTIHSLPCLPSHYILPSIPCRACHLITSYHPFPAVPAIPLHPAILIHPAIHSLPYDCYPITTCHPCSAIVITSCTISIHSFIHCHQQSLL
ncbi:hypothetical protein Pmani_037999 [Petrolisthes manimaculis]|uniref:Uncharacterized protein n=1 Tax=Petrolisthes manimaculis TaxID=1843537 RepID=A0AAE1NHX9_9EUCA|nr:hypothetical protein Pmani_037999 [Petrolisthes manimaculis]